MHRPALRTGAADARLPDLSHPPALGEPVQPHQLVARAGVGGACVRFLVAPPGELREVRGLEEAYEVEGVRGIRIYRKPGYVFRPLRRASDRAGAVLATGATRAEAVAAADRAAALIRLVTKRAEAVA